MNIYGIETSLISVIVLILALFMYLRKRAFNLHKIPQTPTFKQSKPTLAAKRSRSVNLPKGIEVKPLIIGYFPVYPIVRPEAPLS